MLLSERWKSLTGVVRDEAGCGLCLKYNVARVAVVLPLPEINMLSSVVRMMLLTRLSRHILLSLYCV